MTTSYTCQTCGNTVTVHININHPPICNHPPEIAHRPTTMTSNQPAPCTRQTLLFEDGAP